MRTKYINTHYGVISDGSHELGIDRDLYNYSDVKDINFFQFGDSVNKDYVPLTCLFGDTGFIDLDVTGTYNYIKYGLYGSSKIMTYSTSKRRLMYNLINARIFNAVTIRNNIIYSCKGSSFNYTDNKLQFHFILAVDYNFANDKLLGQSSIKYIKSEHLVLFMQKPGTLGAEEEKLMKYLYKDYLNHVFNDTDIEIRYISNLNNYFYKKLKPLKAKFPMDIKNNNLILGNYLK